MASISLSPKSVTRRASTQVQGIKDHPALNNGLPIQLPVVEAKLDKFVKDEAAVMQLRTSLAAAFGLLREGALELNNMVSLNVHYAKMFYGIYAPELTALGGKPRKNARRSAISAPEGGAAPLETK